MSHDLKCWPEYFKAIWERRKIFEIRKNDRNFQVGDTVTLHEWDPTTRREVMEEVALHITDIRHVENLATIHHDGAVLVLSCSASWASGDVCIEPTEADAFAWVTKDEAKGYDLISGLPEEIERAFERRALYSSI